MATLEKSATASQVNEFLANCPKLQEELMKISVDAKLDAFSDVGELWKDQSYERRNKLKDGMTTAGFDPILVEQEVGVYPQLFDVDYYKTHLDCPASIGDRHLLDADCYDRGKNVRRVPYDKGTLIIGAGNSAIPVVLDINLALLSNVAPLIKPDKNNFGAVTELVESFKDAGAHGEDHGKKETLGTLYKSMMVSYFTRDDPNYLNILTRGDISNVKFTGGDEAYQEISKLVAQNPNHVRVLAAGPLTGAIVLDENYVSKAAQNTAGQLAEEILIGGQKMCSSPNYGIWIGSYDGAVSFANNLIKELHLKSKGLKVSESSEAVIQRVRLALRSYGANVVTPEDGSTSATLVVSDGKSAVDEVYKQNKQLPLDLYRKPILLEIVALPDIDSAAYDIETLPFKSSFKGIWKVGTVGYALEQDKKTQLESKISAYRVKPLGRMFYREPTEPLGGDGESLVAFLTHLSYSS